MTNVMRSAWEIAYEGVKKFGGEVKEYFAEALKIAWDLFKKGGSIMKVNRWTTTRGAKIEMHTEHIAERHIGTNDWTEQAMTKKDDRVKVLKMVVNGEEYRPYLDGTRKVVEGMKMVNMGEQRVNGKRINMLILLPKEVESDVWGAYDARMADKKDRQEKIANERAAEMERKVANGYCRRCDSYCYGDCQAN